MVEQFYLDDLIRRAIMEDVNYTDISSEYLFDPAERCRAEIISKDEGVLCGLPVFLRVFELLDPSFTFKTDKKDSDRLVKGEVIAELTGQTLALLKGERTALNLIQHLSGIATQTAKAVEAVKHTKARITDTRKTLPGLRALQKYAVTCAGGKNHRFNLSDAAMLKDNHIQAAGGITAALTRLRENLGHMTKIEVETASPAEVEEALAAGADIIMLDNMDIPAMTKAVELAGGRAVLEASGGITLENLAAVAETGVDIISLGALTHSVKAFDISMNFIDF